MSSRKNNLHIITATTLLFFAFSCSSSSSSHNELTDSVKNIAKKTDTLPATKKNKEETGSETLNLEMNDFEQSILDATEEGFFIVQTEHGFDYIKADINNDGFNDAIALMVYRMTPDMYALDDATTAIMVFQSLDNGKLIQTGGVSGDLGGESIQHKELKKLTWSNGTITYRHRSVENTMAVDIKMKYLQNGGLRALIEKVSLCHYNAGSESECKELFVASEKDTVELIKLNKEFLNTLIEK